MTSQRELTPIHIGNLESTGSGITAIRFNLYRGISESSTQQLISFSQNPDPDLASFTSDPKRFKDRPAFDQWRTKERYPYTLVDPQTDQLAGIVWFGPETNGDYGITFAIRLYEAARQKRLATLFMRATFADFMDTPEYRGLSNHDFWLVTSEGNVRAVGAYESFGFKHLGAADEPDKILMGYKP